MKKIAFMIALNFSLRGNTQNLIPETIFDGGDVLIPLEYSGSSNTAVDMEVQADGKIIALSDIVHMGENYLCLARYNIDGTLDNSFAADGILTTQILSSEVQMTDLEIQVDGKILTGGYIVNDAPAMEDGILLRYNQDGTLDNTFSDDGILYFDFGFSDYVEKIMIDLNNNILLCGTTSHVDDDDFFVLKLLDDGTFDNTYGTNGVLIAGSAGDEYIKTGEIFSDGKVIVAGVSDGFAPQSQFFYAKVDIDGTLDITFGTGGFSTHGTGTAYGEPESICVLPDGSFAVSGSVGQIVGTEYHFDVNLFKYEENGDFDLSFGSNGIATFMIGGVSTNRNEIGLHLTQDSDGKYYVTGMHADIAFNESNLLITRFNTDGSVDLTFDGGDGYYHEDLGASINLGECLRFDGNDFYVLCTKIGITERVGIYKYEFQSFAEMTDKDENKFAAEIFPNPTADFLNIEFYNQNDPANVFLYNNLGDVVMKFEYTGNKESARLNIEHLPNGSYYLTIQQADQFQTLKIIKTVN